MDPLRLRLPQELVWIAPRPPKYITQELLKPPIRWKDEVKEWVAENMQAPVSLDIATRLEDDPENEGSHRVTWDAVADFQNDQDCIFFKLRWVG